VATEGSDILPIVLEKVHYLLPKRPCGCCGKLTTAAAPLERAGTACYGRNINAATILSTSSGNVPVEATAKLMAALLGTPVSTGFVARTHERLARRSGRSRVPSAVCPQAAYRSAQEPARTGRGRGTKRCGRSS
jgi:hypothetical protein